jgi:hypothetical protein
VPATPSSPTPAEAIIRQTLTCLDADALAGAVGAWLADRERSGPAASQRRAVASMARPCAAPPWQATTAARCTCWRAMDHASRTVLAQRQVGGAPAYQLLLEPWTWPGGS